MTLQVKERVYNPQGISPVKDLCILDWSIKIQLTTGDVFRIDDIKYVIVEVEWIIKDMTVSTNEVIITVSKTK